MFFTVKCPTAKNPRTRCATWPSHSNALSGSAASRCKLAQFPSFTRGKKSHPVSRHNGGPVKYDSVVMVRGILGVTIIGYPWCREMPASRSAIRLIDVVFPVWHQAELCPESDVFNMGIAVPVLKCYIRNFNEESSSYSCLCILWKYVNLLALELP